MTKKMTPELQLLISDQAILENLARMTRQRSQAMDALTTSSDFFITSNAQRAAEYSNKIDALMEITRSTMAGQRHEDAFAAALKGDDDTIFDYFFDLRNSLKN